MYDVKAALCDDEPAWLERGERILRAFADSTGMHVEVRSHTDGQSLLADSAEPPDVLFCDIELSEGLSGIDLVRAVSRAWPHCQIVYVTNFLRYAPDVYVTEHLWFVTKERFEERLPEVMDKLQRKMDDGSRVLALYTTAHEELRLPCLDVTHLERRGRETNIFEADGTVHTVRDRLPELIERLPRRMFCRTHGSFAVNLEHLRLLRADEAVLDDGTAVPVSRTHRRSVREAYLSWVDDHAV